MGSCLSEQKHIVGKVDHLLSPLDELEARLREQEETATRLAESLAAAVAMQPWNTRKSPQDAAGDACDGGGRDGSAVGDRGDRCHSVTR
jgi:hypothetical protein